MATTRFTAEGGGQATGSSGLDELYGDLAEADLQPLWRLPHLMPGHPPLADVPFMWKWKPLRHLAERAGALVPLDRGGDRRVLSLCNPGLGGAPFATTTLWGAVQYLGPGEVAPAHHHTPAALRFVIEGEGVWTLVNGDPVAMAPGDLVLTPSWTWHEHRNPGSSPMLWFDGLDIPMIRALDAVFYADAPGGQATRLDAVPASASELAWGGGPGLVPLEADAGEPFSRLLAYRWADTDRALSRLIRGRGARHAALRFADPATGRDVMPTLRCSMHRLLPGERTPTTRRAGSSVWVAFEGSATALVDGQVFDLEPGDMFVVPSWAAFDLEAHEPASLFSVSDAPVLEALGLARTERLVAQDRI